MPAIVLVIIRYLGVTGCVALGIVLFYEGVPLGPLRYVPFLGPALEEFVDGRVDRQRRDGAMSERLAWQEKERKAFKKRLDEERAKQAELDAIAAKYRLALENSTALVIKISGLEEALAKELTDAAPGAPSRPFIPRGVSNKLDAVGR